MKGRRKVNDACIVSSRYKCGVYATTALAAATSFSCFVSATTAAVSRNRKIQKKNSSSSGATTGTSDGGPVPQDTECPCTTTSDCDWALPTYSGVCVDNYCQFTYNPDWTFPLGGYCGYTILNHCAIPTGLTHGVCREGYYQTGTSGSSCGQTLDCVVQNDLNPPHAVCRNKKCQRGVCGDYCGNDSDCLPSGLNCNKGQCAPNDYVSCKDFNNAQ